MYVFLLEIFPSLAYCNSSKAQPHSFDHNKNRLMCSRSHKENLEKFIGYCLIVLHLFVSCRTLKLFLTLPFLGICIKPWQSKVNKIQTLHTTQSKPTGHLYKKKTHILANIEHFPCANNCGENVSNSPCFIASLHHKSPALWIMLE